MTIEPLVDSVVDRAALNFASGPFGTCINGQTFQQEAVLSCRGFQYAGYFAHGGVLCLGRRRLPAGEWQTIRFEDYTIVHHDVHNVVVVGICQGDGSVHLCFDHHGDPLHYRRSVPQLAQRPAEFAWTGAQFGQTTSRLGGKALSVVTYPQFLSTPQGRLQLLYRLGASGDGDWHLAEYDGATGEWALLGMLFSRQGRYATSASRCAYPNPLRYGPGSRLHTTWCWRERPDGGPFDLRTNHDLCYAWSDDFGRTWRDNAGQVVAAIAAGSPGVPASIGIATPGIVVQPTRYLWGQMNTTTEYVDSRGRVHVVNWQQRQDAEAGSADLNMWAYYHYWRDVDGRWHGNPLPFVGRKPQIALDPAGNAYVVYGESDDRRYHGRDPGWRLAVATATEGSGWTDWVVLPVPPPRRFVGEPLLDPVRWRDDGILSVYAQEAPAGAGEPSALRVVDFRVANAAAERRAR